MKQEKFTGRHDTFDYDAIQTEQNGVRKTCCKLVPPGEREHEGGHIHSTTENLVHYCNEKCPTCGYYCTLPFEHSGEHDTRHGNMRRTYFVSDQDVFTLGSRKYAPSESGVAEMCNMYCHRAGRSGLSFLMNSNSVLMDSGNSFVLAFAAQLTCPNIYIYIYFFKTDKMIALQCFA